MDWFGLQEFDYFIVQGMNNVKALLLCLLLVHVSAAWKRTIENVRKSSFDVRTYLLYLPTYLITSLVLTLLN